MASRQHQDATSAGGPWRPVQPAASPGINGYAARSGSSRHWGYVKDRLQADAAAEVSYRDAPPGAGRSSMRGPRSQNVGARPQDLPFAFFLKGQLRSLVGGRQVLW